MKTRRLLPALPLLVLCAQPLLAVPGGSTARSVIRELTERIARTGGSEGTEALTRLGGRQVVEETVERAAREGGDVLVRRVHGLGMRHGADAVKVLHRNPKLYAEALDALPEEQVAPALWGVLRQADTMDDLVARYGPTALRAEALHPGIGAGTLARLGDDALPLLDGLPTAQLARTQRVLDDLAKLPPAERGKVVQALRKAPGAVLDALERRPKLLLTAGGVTAVVAVANQALQPTVTREILPDGTVIERVESFGERLMAGNRREVSWIAAAIAGAIGLRILLPGLRRRRGRA